MKNAEAERSHSVTQPSEERDCADGSVERSKEKHTRLASFVKGVHASLRQQLSDECVSSDVVESIWSDHCHNTALLTEYATAMHQLATDVWANQGRETRLDWCHSACQEYFRKGGGLFKILCKDARHKAFKMSQPLEEVAMPDGMTPIRLLDVGSCFNGFEQYAHYLCIGIDLCPAVDSVLTCDFLHLEITPSIEAIQEDTESHNTMSGSEMICAHLRLLQSPVTCLPAESFHVIVFSLLLEYFPHPSQRWSACVNAHCLLVLHGLLIIITPDSHHAGRRAAQMGDWRCAIESIGFKRCRYEKLEHLHCMAFRKVNSETDCEKKHCGPQSRKDGRTIDGRSHCVDSSFLNSTLTESGSEKEPFDQNKNSETYNSTVFAAEHTARPTSLQDLLYIPQDKRC